MSIREIWVVCDLSVTGDSDLSLQLLSKAAQLKQSNGATVVGVVLKEEEVTDWFACGADKILVNQSQTPETDGDYINLLEQMIKDKYIGLMIFPATTLGKRMAAALSVRLETGLIADCIEIQCSEKDRYVFTRAALNSTVLARIQCVNPCLQMCTVKKNVFSIRNGYGQDSGEVEAFCEPYILSLQRRTVQILNRVKNLQEKQIQLQTAKIVFGVGRGVKASQYPLILEAAKKYGAEIVGTRAAVECNLIERSRQVGQSGESIAPEVYVAFGISGASQHMVGIRNAKIIIAVNNDPEALIFNYADYCINIDLLDILRAL